MSLSNVKILQNVKINNPLQFLEAIASIVYIHTNYVPTKFAGTTAPVSVVPTKFIETAFPTIIAETLNKYACQHTDLENL